MSNRFDDIYKVFKKVEKASNDLDCACVGTDEEWNNIFYDRMNIIEYFELNLAEVLMKNPNIDDEKLAKIILAAKEEHKL